MAAQVNVFKIVDEAHQKLQELRENTELPATTSNRSRFEESAFYEKLKGDALFLESVYDEIVQHPDLKEKYLNVVSEAVILAHDLLKEADVPPKIIAPSVEYASHPLSEDETVAAYKRAFNLILEQEFNRPNVKGELLQEDVNIGPVCTKDVETEPDGTTKIVLKCLKAGVLDKVDPVAAVKYAYAEQAVIDAIRQLLLPRGTYDALQNYANNLDDSYKSIFGDNFEQNLDNFNQKCQTIGSFLAPFIFQKALENRELADKVKFDPVSVAGITTNSSN